MENAMTILLFFLMLIALSTPKTDTAKFPVRFWFDKNLDDTDNFKTGERSNLALYIDHGTGVHYIKSPFGSLTPRLNKDGQPVTEYQQTKLLNGGNKK